MNEATTTLTRAAIDRLQYRHNPFQLSIEHSIMRKLIAIAAAIFVVLDAACNRLPVIAIRSF